MYDVIVIGARVAGAPTAMLLARQGYRVLLVDRATFPSDTLSTHLIHLPGVIRLKQWGVLDQIIASGCPPISQTRFDVGPFALVGTHPPMDSINQYYCVRRTVLDKILVDAALAAGVELREGFTVESLLMEGEQVTGIQGHGTNGTSVKEQARIVVGADGLHSLVARMLNAPVYHELPCVSCAYYTYWSDVPLDKEGIEIYPRPNRLIAAFPTNDGLTCIYVGLPITQFQAYRSDIEGTYRATLELAPSLAERVNNGKQAERFKGTADLPNFFRKPYGPGWALVGDAGYHKDPALAYGISDAFFSAELVAKAIDAGLSERQPMEEALATYERLRNEKLLPHYQINYQMATLEPLPPEMQQLIGALYGNQTEINNFSGAIQGIIPIAEFFSPQNMMRIIGSASH